MAFGLPRREANSDGTTYRLKAGAHGELLYAGKGKTTANGSFWMQVQRNYFTGAKMRFFILRDYEQSSRPVRNEHRDAVLFTADEKIRSLNINKVAAKVIVEPT